MNRSERQEKNKDVKRHRRGGRGRIMRGLEDQSEVFRFYLKCNRKPLKNVKQSHRIVSVF